MSSWSYALTNKGRQLQAKAQAGAQLVYTRMAVGSGTLSGQSLESMTALIAPVKDLTITRLKRPAGSTRALIGATLTNQDVTTGFYLREIGIFATDPDDGEILYMYANAGATADYIAPQGDGVIEKALNMNVFVGSAANITANIDESLVYATQQDLADAIAGIQINDATTTQKGIVQLSNATNSTAEDKAATPKAVKLAYDAATAAQTTANAANLAAAAAQTKADQAFQFGNERKQEVVDILIAKGISASTSESWDSLLSKMSAIIRATGNATAADVLEGKTASNASGPFTGSMPNRSAENPHQPSGAVEAWPGDKLFLMPPAGYYNGASWVYTPIPNIKPENVRSGVEIIKGIVGTLQPRISGVIPLTFYDSQEYAAGQVYKNIAQLPPGVKRITFLSDGVRSSYLSSVIYGNTALVLRRASDNATIVYPIITNTNQTHNFQSFSIDLEAKERRLYGDKAVGGTGYEQFALIDSITETINPNDSYKLDYFINMLIHTDPYRVRCSVFGKLYYEG